MREYSCDIFGSYLSSVYCTAAGTIFGTTDVYELGYSYLSISIFKHGVKGPSYCKIPQTYATTVVMNEPLKNYKGRRSVKSLLWLIVYWIRRM